jgi:hypothetical protein
MILRNTIAKLIIAATLLLDGAFDSVALADNLPQGVGIMQYGFRQMGTTSNEYDANGNQVGMGGRFDKSFDGPSLLANPQGDLGRLVQELKRYEETTGQTGLVDRFSLGSLRGEVDATVSAQVVGLAFGVGRGFALFAGAPFIDASVNASLVVEGENTSQQLRKELGDFAFSELDVGLQRAAAFSVKDVENEIYAKGYEKFNSWQRSGFGDLRLGLRREERWALPLVGRVSQTWSSAWVLPTGYKDDPDRLTDFGFGKGTHQLVLDTAFQAAIPRVAQGRLRSGFGGSYNAPAERTVRLPENEESLVDSSRKTDVKWDRGDEFTSYLGVGWETSSWGAIVDYGFDQKGKDQYSGQAVGNYETLENGTNEQRAWARLGLSHSAVDAYRRGRMPIPFLVEFSAFNTVSGLHTRDEQFVELKLSTFFTTRAQSRSKNAPRRSGNKSVTTASR